MPGKVTELTKNKITAIERYIVEQRDIIHDLEAKMLAMPADTPKAHREYHEQRLASERARLRELKAQKRKPGTLLMLDNFLPVDEATEQAMERIKLDPRNAEMVAALKAEQWRINQEYRERTTKARKSARKLGRDRTDG